MKRHIRFYYNLYSDSGGGTTVTPQTVVADNNNPSSMDNVVDEEFAKEFLQGNTEPNKPTNAQPPAATPPAPTTPSKVDKVETPKESGNGQELKLDLGLTNPNAVVDEPKPGSTPIEPEAPTQYHNLAHLAMQAIGYEDDVIIYNEKEIKFTDLTDEQQAEVVYDTISDQKEYYENIINQLQQTGALVDEREARLLEAFRVAQGDPAKFLEVFQQANPALMAKNLDDRQLVALDLKRQYPEWTDQDVDDELEEIKPSSLERRAKSLRAQYNQANSNEDYIAKLPRYAGADLDPEVLADSQMVTDYIFSLPAIADIPLQPDNKQFLAGYTAQVNPNSGLTSFLEEMTDPQQLTHAAFWHVYGPGIYKQMLDGIEALKEQAHREGRRSVIHNYPDTPTFATGSNNTSLNPGQLTDDDFERVNGPQGTLGT